MNTWFYIAAGLYIYVMVVQLFQFYLMRKSRLLTDKLLDLLEENADLKNAINTLKELEKTEKP